MLMRLRKMLEDMMYILTVQVGANGTELYANGREDLGCGSVCARHIPMADDLDAP